MVVNVLITILINLLKLSTRFVYELCLRNEGGRSGLDLLPTDGAVVCDVV